MEENKQITVKDALIFTKETLIKIQVPVEMKESVIDPVWNAIRNIEACIIAIENAEKQEKFETETVQVDVEEINGEEE